MKNVPGTIVAQTLLYTRLLDVLQNKLGKSISRAGNRLSSLPFCVLLYHRVTPEKDMFFPSVQVNTFDAQMRYLAEHYRVLPLSTLLNRIGSGERDPYEIAITFDDGYRDNFTYAHPIMRKYGLAASLFVASGYIGTNRIMWNDQLSMAFKHATGTELSFQEDRVTFTCSLRSQAEKLKSRDLVLQLLKSVDENDRKRMAKNIVAKLGSVRHDADALMLTWDELRKMAHEGWEIGSHTVNHVILTQVDEATAVDELRNSKRMLEEQLQRRVTFLAYPNGKRSDFDSNTKRIALAAGYRAALTTLSGLNRPDVDLFELRRDSPWEEKLASFALKINFKYWKEFCRVRTISGGIAHEM